MPYRSEKIQIAGTKHDGRRKLSDEQKGAIIILRKKGHSYRKLAEKFGVSKSLIQSIIRPQSRAKPKNFQLSIGPTLKGNTGRENKNYMKTEK